MNPLAEVRGTIGTLRRLAEDRLRTAGPIEAAGLKEARFQANAAELSLTFGDMDGAALHIRRARHLLG